MSADDTSSPPTDAQAIAWHARVQSGNMTQAERGVFESWRADPRNAAAYAEIKTIWTMMRPMPGARSQRALARRARTPQLRKCAIAASLALMLGLSAGYLQIWRHDVAVMGSQVVSKELSEHSRLALAPGAAIDIDYRPGLRQISLARGEVYFDVAHDSDRPFVINAGTARVRVLGTAFSVRRDGERVDVIVARGKVRVNGARTRVDLLPGQSVTFQAGMQGAVVRRDPAKALAWTRGRLIFENKPLGDVLAELDRYYPGIILVARRAAARRPIDASIDLKRIDAWLDTLERTQGLAVHRLPGMTVLR